MKELVKWYEWHPEITQLYSQEERSRVLSIHTAHDETVIIRKMDGTKDRLDLIDGHWKKVQSSIRIIKELK